MKVSLLWDDSRREHAEPAELVGVFVNDVAALEHAREFYPDHEAMDYYVQAVEVQS